MQHFYKHVLVDLHNKNFYTECESCRKREYADKLPGICRYQKVLMKLESGKADIIRQKIYNHKKALAVQYLARYFNQCSRCGKWVCDDCYHMDVSDGICSVCHARK